MATFGLCCPLLTITNAGFLDTESPVSLPSLSQNNFRQTLAIAVALRKGHTQEGKKMADLSTL